MSAGIGRQYTGWSRRSAPPARYHRRMGPSRQAMAMALGLVLLPGTVEARAERLIVVVTDGWNAPRGQLRRFLRPAAGALWEPVGEPVAVVVGKSGLGWGRGSRPRPPQVALDGPG